MIISNLEEISVRSTVRALGQTNGMIPCRTFYLDVSSCSPQVCNVSNPSAASCWWSATRHTRKSDKRILVSIPRKYDHVCVCARVCMCVCVCACVYVRVIFWFKVSGFPSVGHWSVWNLFYWQIIPRSILKDCPKGIRSFHRKKINWRTTVPRLKFWGQWTTFCNIACRNQLKMTACGKTALFSALARDAPFFLVGSLYLVAFHSFCENVSTKLQKTKVHTRIRYVLSYLYTLQQYLKLRHAKFVALSINGQCIIKMWSWGQCTWLLHSLVQWNWFSDVTNTCNAGASSDQREPISLHQAVCL